MPIVFPKWDASAVSAWGELLVEDADGNRNLNEATALLLNYLPIIGVPRLTDENAFEAWCRIAMHQSLFGGILENSDTGESFYITKFDVLRHVGIETEGEQKTLAEYCRFLIHQAQHGHEERSPFFAANGGKSLLEVLSITSTSDMRL